MPRGKFLGRSKLLFPAADSFIGRHLCRFAAGCLLASFLHSRDVPAIPRASYGGLAARCAAFSLSLSLISLLAARIYIFF